MKSLIFLALFSYAVQQDSNSKDNTVFLDSQAYEQKLHVGMQTENILPDGHMKKLGEHAQPITGDITELDYMIGGKDFYEQFSRKRRPVIFRGVTQKWKSTTHWKNETYLLEKYSDVLFDVETGKVYDAALHTRQTMDMRQFLSEYKKRTLYLDSPFPHTPMMADMEVPLMLQCDETHRKISSMHLLFSNGNTSSPLHHDGYENFLSSFSGIKVAYLIEPKYGKELYVEFVEDFPGLSPINPEAVDFVKYPLFNGVPYHKIVINPGDMLYIPQFWYHQVRSYHSPNIAAAMWFSVFDIPNVEDFGYREVLNIAEKFDVGVSAAPETIECFHQNRPMNEVLGEDHVDFTRFKEITSPNGSVVNSVDLHDEVLPGQPTLYAGSDDTYIYAVDMLNGKIKWRIKTGKDTGSTCKFNENSSLVYCGADDGHMRAMHFNNGSILWQFYASGAIISSVQLDDRDNLYFGSLDYYMYSIDNTGKKLWRRFLGDQVWSTPLLVPDLDILVIGTKVVENGTRSNVFALEMSSGRFVWRLKVEGGLVASPRLIKNRSSVYICSVKGYIYEVDLIDGTIIHKMFLNTTDDESLWSTPSVGPDGTVYILTGSHLLYAIDTNNRNVKWNIDLAAHKDKEDNSIKEDDRGSNSSPYLSPDGHLYVGAGFGIVFAINTTNAQIKWQTRVGTGIFFSSPRLSKNAVLYIGTLDGFLVALDSKTGDEVWRLETNGPFVGTALITKGFS